MIRQPRGHEELAGSRRSDLGVRGAGAIPGFWRDGLRRDPGGFPGHYGWPAPPAANFFRARSLATIDTLPNWPKTRGLELAQNRPFTGGHFILFYLL